MLFRRIKAHIAREDWFSVFVDFLIVVIGVFVGIQVQTYYQSQTEQRQMRDYLGRLHEDMTLSFQGTENTRKFVSENLENLMVVVRSVRECAIRPEDEDKFANGLFHLGKSIPAQFVDGTLVELRASGRLLLLQNAELRKAINRTVHLHEYLARVMPALQRRVAMAQDYVDSKTIYLIDREVDGFSMIERLELDIDLDEVCQDREFEARLSALQRMANTNIGWLDRSLANFRMVLTLLEEELNAQSQAD